MALTTIPQSGLWGDIADQINDNNLSLKGGIVDYNHGGAAQALTADTFLALNNDGAGAFTNTTYLPDGITSMLTDNKIDATGLALGGWLMVRSTFSITPTTNNQAIDIRYTLGAGGGAYTVGGYVGQLRLGAGVEEPFSRAELLYIGDANTRDNTIGIEVRTSGPSSVQNAGFAIGIAGSKI